MSLAYHFCSALIRLRVVHPPVAATDSTIDQHCPYRGPLETKHLSIAPELFRSVASAVSFCSQVGHVIPLLNVRYSRRDGCWLRDSTSEGLHDTSRDPLSLASYPLGESIAVQLA